METADTIAAVAGRTISIVSHTGGIGVSMYDKCFRAGLGVRYVVTTGNEADIDMIEVMDHLINEAGTRIILAYIEGFNRPEKFAPVAAKATDSGVQIIVLKAGTSPAGEQGDLAYRAYDGFQQRL